jgi:hypothetical protein
MSNEEIKDITEEVIVEETNTEVEAPLTEARTISAINASLQEMNKDELDAIFEAAEKAKAKAKVESEDDEEDEDEDEEGDDEEGEVETEKKESKKKVQKEETFKEDLDALVKDEADLSEGFKAKAGTIFEAALQNKVATATVQLEERYASDLTEEVTAIKEDLVDKVDGYLNYVVENWMTDNEVAIEHGLKSEITESFINAMHGVFTEHYINVPEDKVEIVDALTEEVSDAKDQLNTATAANVELSEKVKSFEMAAIVTEASEGLAATEAAKLKELTESIDAADLEEFASKVATIKESYLTKDDKEVVAEEIDAITEDTKDDTQVTSDMASYLDAMSKLK